MGNVNTHSSWIIMDYRSLHSPLDRKASNSSHQGNGRSERLIPPVLKNHARNSLTIWIFIYPLNPKSYCFIPSVSGLKQLSQSPDRTVKTAREWLFEPACLSQSNLNTTGLATSTTWGPQTLKVGWYTPIIIVLSTINHSEIGLTFTKFVIPLYLWFMIDISILFQWFMFTNSIVYDGAPS